MSATPRFRPMPFGITRVSLRDGANGTHFLNADQALQPYPERLTDRLAHWAEHRPQQTWMARRAPSTDGSGLRGQWQHVTFAQAWA